MQLQLQNPKLDTLPFEQGGSPRGHIRGGTEPTGALVGILALPLPPMGWIHAIGKFSNIHQFTTLHVTLSTQLEFMALHFSI
jgi:hypothetical protein